MWYSNGMPMDVFFYRNNSNREMLPFFYHKRLLPRDQATVLSNAAYREVYERTTMASARRKQLSTLKLFDHERKAHKARIEAMLHAGAENDSELAYMAWEILGKPGRWEILGKPERSPGEQSDDGSEAEGWWLGL